MNVNFTRNPAKRQRADRIHLSALAAKIYETEQRHNSQSINIEIKSGDIYRVAAMDINSRFLHQTENLWDPPG